MTKEEIANRGNQARAQLLAVTNKPIWHMRQSAMDMIAAHLGWGGPNGSGPLNYLLETSAPAAPETEDDCGYEVTPEGIAIIPIHGPLLDCAPSWWMQALGYASTPQIADAIEDAGEDARVKTILLHIDSPGGMVSGLAAACDAAWTVRQAGRVRTVAACKQACSAAYEIASQCEKIYLSQDGYAGCLGTMFDMSDWSANFKAMGVERFVIASDGAEVYKGEGGTGLPVTEAQRADFKRIANEYRTLFNGIVQRGRGWDAEMMQRLADGRSHIGANARALGLVEAIQSPDAVLSLLGSGTEIEDDPMPDCGAGEDSPPIDKSQKPRTTLQAAPGVNRAAFVLPDRPAIGTAANRGAATYAQAHSMITPVSRVLGTLPGEERRMKEKLVRALTNLGLGRMAVAVLGSSSDEPEALAATMAEQVKTEAKEMVDVHPLVMACRAANISDASQFAGVLNEASLGRKALSSLREDAHKQAIRLYGATDGPKVSASINDESADIVERRRDSWAAEANTKYGIGKDGTGANRETAPPALPHSADVDKGAGAPASKWDSLTPAQQAHGNTMGMKTPEQRESFAANYTGEKVEA